MKIFAISDLHLNVSGSKPMDIFGDAWANYTDAIRDDWQKKVSVDDVVLIAGDISWAMKMEELDEAKTFLDSLNGTKIMIRGNHDYWWQSISKVRDYFGKGYHLLQNDAVKIGEVVFCGTRGWSMCEKACTPNDKRLVARECIRLDMALASAKKLAVSGEKIVALVHYPPFNYCHENSDFTELFEKYGADVVVYGHLHGKDAHSAMLTCKNGIDYYLTSCDLVKNTLVEIDIKK